MQHKCLQSPRITWDVTTVTEDYQVEQKKKRQIVRTTKPTPPGITWEVTTVIEDYQIPR